MPLEVLCRGVEATCRHGRAEKLFAMLRERCKGFLEGVLLKEVERESATGGDNVGRLRTVWKYWSMWNEQSVS